MNNLRIIDLRKRTGPEASDRMFRPAFSPVLLCPSLLLFKLVYLLFLVVFYLSLSFLLFHEFFSVHLFLFIAFQFVSKQNSFFVFLVFFFFFFFFFFSNSFLFFLPIQICFILFCSPFCLPFLLVFTNIFPLICLFFATFFSSTPLFLPLSFFHS